MHHEHDGAAIKIRHTELSAEALQGVIDEFITREGTEYGLHDIELASKRRDVVRQLERGEAQITFNADTGTTSIVSVTGKGVD